MSTDAADARREPDIEQALMDAAEAIADMAERVRLNGPEVTYASEKLGHALCKAAEGLAMCGVEIDEVTAEACQGHQHGAWLTGPRDVRPRAAVPFVIHPRSRADARLRVTCASGAVVVLAADGCGAAGIRLTANEARVLANVLSATARRLEGRSASSRFQPMDRPCHIPPGKARDVIGIGRKAARNIYTARPAA